MTVKDGERTQTKTPAADLNLMARLNGLEWSTLILTSIIFGGLCFPGPTTADFAGGVIAAWWTFLGLANVVLWIKDGTDKHL